MNRIKRPAVVLSTVSLMAALFTGAVPEAAPQSGLLLGDWKGSNAGQVSELTAGGSIRSFTDGSTAERKNKGPFTSSIMMNRQETPEGPVPYTGRFGPIYDGAIISKINFPTEWPAVLLVKQDHSATECYSNPDAVVQVWGDITADQTKAIWGTSNPSTDSYPLNFVGCTTSNQLPNSFPVNITWSKP